MSRVRSVKRGVCSLLGDDLSCNETLRQRERSRRDVCCVAQGCEALVGAKFLTQDEGDVFVSQASKSNVGK